MTRLPDGERIAALEANMTNLTGQIAEINKKLDRVVNALAEMSGGKKAVLGIFALIGSAVGVLATLFGMQLHLFGK